MYKLDEDELHRSPILEVMVLGNTLMETLQILYHSVYSCTFIRVQKLVFDIRSIFRIKVRVY